MQKIERSIGHIRSWTHPLLCKRAVTVLRFLALPVCLAPSLAVAKENSSPDKWAKNNDISTATSQSAGSTTSDTHSAWLGDLSGLLYYVPTITAKVTLANLVNVPASPTWFGGKCDGQGGTDNAAAINAALATGLAVSLPAGDCRLTAGLVSQATGQIARGQGPGRTRLFPSGNFDIFTATGGVYGAGLQDVTIEAGGMTGGTALVVNNADRTNFRNVIIHNPWNYLSVKKANTTTVETGFVNNARGTAIVSLYGDASNRSDVVRLTNLALSGNATARPTGILWDGNVNTLEINSVGIVNAGIGLKTQNTAGAGAPAFLFANDLEIDFPQAQAVWLGAGEGFWFSNLYAQGSATSHGFQVDSGVVRTSVHGGKISANALAGVLNNGSDTQIDGASVYGNSKTTPGAWSGVTAGATSVDLAVRSRIGDIGTATQRYGVEALNGAIRTNTSGSNLIGNLLGEWYDGSGGGNGSFVATGNTASPVSLASNVIASTVAGIGAQISLTVSGGAVTAATVQNGGRGYTSAPSAVLSGGGGSGAMVTLAVSAGVVTGATVTAGGSGYTSAPLLYVSPAAATPIIRSYSHSSAKVALTMRAQGGSQVLIGNDNGTFLEVFDSQARFGNATNVNGTYGGIHVASPSSFSTAGDSQASLHVLRAQGTGTRRLDAAGLNAGTGGTSIPLADNSAIELSCKMVARNTSTGDAAEWKLEDALLTRGAGASTTALVGGSWVAGPATARAIGLTPSIAADTTNGGPNISIATTSGYYRVVARCWSTYIK